MAEKSIVNFTRSIRKTALAAPVLAWVLMIGAPAPAPAQSNGEAPRLSEERERIQARITELEAQLASQTGDERMLIRSELERLRRRLTHGDFDAGDMIVLRVLGEETLSDTFRVEAPRRLRLPGLEPIDLTGVLRTEIEPYLREQIARFVRNPQVRASALIRVGVLGAVNAPGFYTVPPSIAASDVFAPAGGFARNANVEKVRVRRLGEPLIESKVFRQAMASGWDLDRLGVRPGDEIYVPAGSGMSARDWVWVVSGVAGITFTVLRIVGAI